MVSGRRVPIIVGMTFRGEELNFCNYDYYIQFCLLQVRNYGAVRRRLLLAAISCWHCVLDRVLQFRAEPSNLRVLQSGVQGGFQEDTQGTFAHNEGLFVLLTQLPPPPPFHISLFKSLHLPFTVHSLPRVAVPARGSQDGDVGQRQRLRI